MENLPLNLKEFFLKFKSAGASIKVIFVSVIIVMSFCRIKSEI